MKKIILILSLLLLVNCGFNAILSTKDKSFKINNIETPSNDKVSLKIKKKLQIYKKTNTPKKEYNLKINTQKNTIIASKDTKGDPLTYEMIILTKLEIFSKDKFIKDIVYKKNLNYNNRTNKFELKQFEKNSLENLINQITENIIVSLLSL